MAEVLRLDVEVRLEGAEEDILRMLSDLRPAWKKDDVTIDVISGGLVNNLWRVRNSNYGDDALLVRRYGDGTEQYVNREQELSIMEALHKKEAIPALYCRFLNGMVYKFCPGRRMTYQDLLNPAVSQLVIKRLHQVHSLSLQDVSVSDEADHILDTWSALSDMFDQNIEQIEKIERYVNNFPKGSAMQSELNEAMDVYKEMAADFPKVLLHGDPHMHNIIYNPETHSLDLLDWEDSGRGCELMDIGIHLTRDPLLFKDAGFDIMEGDYVADFVKMYLNSHPSMKSKDITEELIKKWTVGVFKSIYVSCWFLLPWGFCQVISSNIEFDYFEGAIFYYDMANKAKKKFQNQ